MTPDVFRGIQFWGIAWEFFDLKPRVLLTPSLHFRIAVDAPTIPEYKDGSVEVFEQILKETLDIWPFEASLPELQIERNPFAPG